MIIAENKENVENINENVEDKVVEDKVDEDKVVENIEKNNDTGKKKKKTKRYFEHHIRKILKQITGVRDITYQARSQLNDIAVYTCKNVKDKSNQILMSLNKKTLTED